MVGDKETIIALARRVAVHDALEEYWTEQSEIQGTRNAELREQVAELCEERVQMLAELEELKRQNKTLAALASREIGSVEVES